MSLRDWMQLSLTSGLGPVLIRRLIDRAGSAAAAVNAGTRELELIEGIGPARAATIHRSMAEAAGQAQAEIEKAKALGMAILCPDDSAYPTLLRGITDPPSVLYVKGALEPRDLNAMAIVGSRRCSHYGREQADRFAALLAGSGFTIVSGGARGVDSSAHRGAMQHPHGRTIAVLGSGLDVPYPPENGHLFDEIAQRGAVLSEFPLGTPPVAENFPRRNRIVSGLSRGVLVIEADVRSGALITARLAGAEQGRAVFALPGRVDNPTSAGAHRLIRDGAILVTCLEDILEGLGPLPQDALEPTLYDASPADPMAPMGVADLAPREDRPALSELALTPRQQAILAELSSDPLAVDQVIERTGLEASAVMQELTLLSLKGLIRRVDGQRYARSRPPLHGLNPPRIE